MPWLQKHKLLSEGVASVIRSCQTLRCLRVFLLNTDHRSKIQMPVARDYLNSRRWIVLSPWGLSSLPNYRLKLKLNSLMSMHQGNGVVFSIALASSGCCGRKGSIISLWPELNSITFEKNLKVRNVSVVDDQYHRSCWKFPRVSKAHIWWDPWQYDFWLICLASPGAKEWLIIKLLCDWDGYVPCWGACWLSCIEWNRYVIIFK